MAFRDGDGLLAAYLAESGEADLAEEAPPRAWEDGRAVGEWTVTGFLARGGSAEVYCARHRRLGTVAALKTLWREGEGPRERFALETRFLMSNPGPSFPAFYGEGEEAGRPWVAMELLDECPLPATDGEVARYVEDVARGVAELHARGWLHRDLKPRNILRRADGHAVLADFGLLKAIGEAEETAASGPSPSVVDGREMGVGTPGYAAPEQFSGNGATPAADVYGLGMLVEECFSGHPPRAWERIVRRATAALPRQRYASVEAFLLAVRHRHRRRNAARAALAAAGIALAAAAVAWTIRAMGPAGRGWQADRAREKAARRASAGPAREAVEGILADMVPLSDQTPGKTVWMGKHEVTQAQWDALMEHNPSRFRGADRPVDGVDIGDCLEFLGRLNRTASAREGGWRFRLPTAAEWERAASDPTGRDEYRRWETPEASQGWFAENAGGETHPVGQKRPNARGFFDLYGNVAELLFSFVHTASGTHRALEVDGMRCFGGSCLQEARECDIPVVRAALGREIETLPEEWREPVRKWGLPVELPEAMRAVGPERVEDFLGRAAVGFRLCADKLPES